MKQGYLSQYFEGVALKRLSAVEADFSRSHQHEYNGVEGLKTILGEPDGKVRYPTRFLYLTDHDDEPILDDGELTWYDARQRARLERRVMRWEYRLYFPGNSVMTCAAEGDLLVVAKRSDGQGLLLIVAEKGSTIEQQVAWLFGYDDRVHPGFSVRSELETDQDRIGFAAGYILQSIGVELEEQAPNYLDEMLLKFGGTFPTTQIFSAYARATLRDVSARENADTALVVWMEREEVLFRTLERHLLGDQLQQLQRRSAEMDPDAFMKLSMSFQQRRKSRAGSALENHVEAVFSAHGVTYSRTAVTENNLKPDFVLPSIRFYRDPLFPSARLTMLAAKTTCKDRWRQIINEASRIDIKHLLTLEPRISSNQTAEMLSEHVQLVLPESLHSTYTAEQAKWLMTVGEFIDLAKQRQIVDAVI
jgi:hypothetical protein